MKAAEIAQQGAEAARRRSEVVADLLELRQDYSGMDFNLTDEIVRMREEEDV